MRKSSLTYFIKEKDVDVDKMHLLGKLHPSKYFKKLKKQLYLIDFPIEPFDNKSSLLKMDVQNGHILEIGNRHLLAALISQPYPNEKKTKPSGLVFEDFSFLQIKEILLYDIKTKELFLYEYSYHYGIWDYDNDKEIYSFRYDREVLLANPPKKNVEHFHVMYNDPHFPSKIVNLEFVITLIKNNWDTKLNKFFIKELVY